MSTTHRCTLAECVHSHTQESNHSSALFQEHEHVAQAMVQRDRAVEDLQHLLHVSSAWLMRCAL